MPPVKGRHLYSFYTWQMSYLYSCSFGCFGQLNYFNSIYKYCLYVRQLTKLGVLEKVGKSGWAAHYIIAKAEPVTSGTNRT